MTSSRLASGRLSPASRSIDRPPAWSQGSRVVSVTSVRWSIIAVVVAVLAATTVVVCARTHDAVLVSYWSIGVGVIVFCLVSFVVGRRYTHLPMAGGRVLAIIPAYNEETESLHKTVRSLLVQTRPPDAIYVIDDGSAYPVETFDDPRVVWMRQENTGKRGAQCTVLNQFGPGDWDFIMTVDSTTRSRVASCASRCRQDGTTTASQRGS